MRRADRSDEPIEQMLPVTAEEYQELAKTTNTSIIGELGERIVGGLLRANRYKEGGSIRAMWIHDGKIQQQEKDIVLYYGNREQAYEVKTDKRTFTGYGVGKASSENEYGAFCGSILGGTGNLFIEEVQYAPKEWGDKVPSDEQIQSLTGRDRGWMQVIRDTLVEHPEEQFSRFVWFVPYMGYVEGRRQLIVAVPDECLIKLIEEKKGSLEWKSFRKLDGKEQKLSWGRILPIKDLFEFDVVCERIRDPYMRANFSKRDETSEKILLGAASKNGSGAVAYLWSVDQGEAGYTTVDKTDMVIALKGAGRL